MGRVKENHSIGFTTMTPIMILEIQIATMNWLGLSLAANNIHTLRIAEQDDHAPKGGEAGGRSRMCGWPEP
ncbi:unnamed protein product [Prunus armeniaca]|uniref:Uncharacterized protein n=1 Tax=Prunus armeniaca TaxID=36596 RepID=A0A6J5TWB2_PRUAR|nr:unnamed protein product [Prunus armeniaca]CAB4298448.1 unnamed protein product [Prunus armeniaca]